MIGTIPERQTMTSFDTLLNEEGEYCDDETCKFYIKFKCCIITTFGSIVALLALL